MSGNCTTLHKIANDWPFRRIHSVFLVRLFVFLIPLFFCSPLSLIFPYSSLCYSESPFPFFFLSPFSFFVFLLFYVVPLPWSILLPLDISTQISLISILFAFLTFVSPSIPLPLSVSSPFSLSFHILHACFLPFRHFYILLSPFFPPFLSNSSYFFRLLLHPLPITNTKKIAKQHPPCLCQSISVMHSFPSWNPYRKSAWQSLVATYVDCMTSCAR